MAKAKPDALETASQTVGDTLLASVLNNEDTVAEMANEFELFQVNEDNEFVGDENGNPIIDDEQVENFVSGAIKHILPFLPDSLAAIAEEEQSTLTVDIWLNQDPDTPEAEAAVAGEAPAEEQPQEEQKAAATTTTAGRTRSGLMSRNKTATAKNNAPAKTGAGPTTLKRRALRQK